MDWERKTDTFNSTRRSFEIDQYGHLLNVATGRPTAYKNPVTACLWLLLGPDGDVYYVVTYVSVTMYIITTTLTRHCRCQKYLSFIKNVQPVQPRRLFRPYKIKNCFFIFTFL